MCPACPYGLRCGPTDRQPEGPAVPAKRERKLGKEREKEESLSKYVQCFRRLGSYASSQSNR